MPPMEIRTQNDGLQNVYSELAQLDCSVEPDLARQDMKAETDIHDLLKRYGAEVQVRTGPLFGNLDFDMDLQNVMDATTDLKAAHRKLLDQRPELRGKYPTTALFLEALQSGRIANDFLPAQVSEPKPTQPTPATEPTPQT